MKRVISQAINYLFKKITKLYTIDKNLILIFSRGYSGSNLSSIIDQIKAGEALVNYKIEIVESCSVFLNNYEKLKNKWKEYKLLNTAKLIITTHGPMKLNKKSINLELWHGFPIKSMNLMDKSENKIKIMSNIDYIISLSSTYNTLINACFGINAKKYIVTGYPRNDILLNANGMDNLRRLLQKKVDDKKTILFMPTYRKSQSKHKEDGKKNDNNFFGFGDFDLNDFNNYLEKNNYYFLMKLHPNEEKFYKEKYSNSIGENIFFIDSLKLEELKMDFYNILNAVDILITDYSSIYFDFLLLDRPIIFTPIDYEEYKHNRGFLLEPFDFWAPGDKCFCYEDLKLTIDENLEIDSYEKERNVLKNIVHEFNDNHSTERVIALIDKLMREHE